MSGLYGQFAAAYVRGMVPGLADKADFAALVAAAKDNGLELHRFKRTQELPRVRAVIGVLKGLAPNTLLDVGSGRGVFLWPLLDAFPTLRVTCVEIDTARARHLQAVRRGGVDRLEILEGDARITGLAADSFDVVTVLEVLEHQTSPIDLAREAIRLASRFVLVSVPSKPDHNPEHVQLFTKDSLEALMRAAGASSVKIRFVLNHMIAVARV